MKVDRTACINALRAMEIAFRALERKLPPPRAVPYKDSFQLRFQEMYVEQALIQKLARQISGLHAIDVLLLNGFVQEQAVIQRTLDEIGEDIIFLSLSLTNHHLTQLHEQYLDAFWAEEFDADTAVESTQKRNYPPRRKIIAYNSRHGGLTDPSSANENARTISKAYSGYVHASSPQIMDMCGGDPPRFFLRGMRGTARMSEHVEDAWNYFYRGLLSATFVAKAFGDAAITKQLYDSITHFENSSETKYFNGDFVETDR